MHRATTTSARRPSRATTGPRPASTTSTPRASSPTRASRPCRAARGGRQLRASTFVEAIDAYKNFIKDHPTHPKVDYASCQIAKSHYKDLPSNFFLFPPAYEKDQAELVTAQNAIKDFLLSYPSSEYRAEGEKMMGEVRRRLAEHEMYVASSTRKGYKKAAALRYEGVVVIPGDTPFAGGSGASSPSALCQARPGHPALRASPSASGAGVELERWVPCWSWRAARACSLHAIPRARSAGFSPDCRRRRSSMRALPSARRCSRPISPRSSSTIATRRARCFDCVKAAGTWGGATLGYYGSERITFERASGSLKAPGVWLPRLEGVLTALAAREQAIASRDATALARLAGADNHDGAITQGAARRCAEGRRVSTADAKPGVGHHPSHRRRSRRGVVDEQSGGAPRFFERFTRPSR